MNHPPSLGLLLLTGGQGRRLGGPKHPRLHPQGGSWGGHLVNVFSRVAPQGPIHILGEPLPDRPDLVALPDDGQGVAQALMPWASQPAPNVDRWWLVACDQVRWSAALLAEWHALAQGADPQARQWVVAKAAGTLQPLGGFLPHVEREAMATHGFVRISDLVKAMPHCILPWESEVWDDVDTPGDLARWQGN